jgi:hypothetical protein
MNAIETPIPTADRLEAKAREQHAAYRSQSIEVSRRACILARLIRGGSERWQIGDHFTALDQAQERAAHLALVYEATLRTLSRVDLTRATELRGELARPITREVHEAIDANPDIEAPDVPASQAPLF